LVQILGQIMRALLLTVILVTPCLADPIPGLDDPAFQAPFQRALETDDPTALIDLHAAAEAGNTAALLALPAVSDWLRPALPFSERRKLGRINGTPVAEAYAAADPTAALWALGDFSIDMDALLQRAFALYDAGEPDKATLLFMTWLNQTGGYGPLPSGFFDHPTPAWAGAILLWGRLNDTTFAPPAETDALVVGRLRADDPAAWIALAGYSGLHRPDASPPDTARLTAILQAAGIAQDKAVQKMRDAAPALRAGYRHEPILDPATAAAATASFRNDPTFQPLLTLCATACPDTADQCTTAFVAAFGHPVGRATRAQPLTSLISTEDFFATPRGRQILLRATKSALGDTPATSPALKAARDIDACLADTILAAPP
jgi:hypothetical protein